MVLLASQLVAHRGHQNAFPENSLLAILDAIAAGAVNIEFDIQLTADAVPVLYHDDAMERLSGVDLTITATHSNELTRMTSYEPERLGQRFIGNPIGYLKDLLPIIWQCGHIQFFMELKEESIEAHGLEKCLSALVGKESDLPDNLWLISFDHQAVKQAKGVGFAKTALVFRDWSQRDYLLQETNADMGYINYKRIPETELISACRPIVVYEVADKILANNLLSRGATAVETFSIRQMLGNL